MVMPEAIWGYKDNPPIGQIKVEVQNIVNSYGEVNNQSVLCLPIPGN